MLMIRLQRTGRRNSPAYRVVVAEKRDAVKGRWLEIVGHHLPTREPAVTEINTERVGYWLGKGATPSDTVARLLTKQGVQGLEKYIDSYTKKRPKKEPPPEAAAPAPAPAPEATAEVPVEEEPKKEEAPAEEPKEEETTEEEAPAEEEAKQEEEDDKKEKEA